MSASRRISGDRRDSWSAPGTARSVPVANSRMREPRRSSRCSKCRYYCRAGTTSLMSHFGLCSLVVGYCVMGAFLFEFLEATNERNKRLEMMRWRSNLADALWQLTSESRILDQTNWTGEAVARLRRFEVTLVQAVRKEGYDGKEDAQLQWSFTGALLYSIIVITTIGEYLGVPERYSVPSLLVEAWSSMGFGEPDIFCDKDILLGKKVYRSCK
ncbi:hypothetical protein MRX96_054921 [Rhipicephalus microplus]